MLSFLSLGERTWFLNSRMFLKKVLMIQSPPLNLEKSAWLHHLKSTLLTCSQDDDYYLLAWSAYLNCSYSLFVENLFVGNWFKTPTSLVEWKLGMTFKLDGFLFVVKSLLASAKSDGFMGGATYGLFSYLSWAIRFKFLNTDSPSSDTIL